MMTDGQVPAFGGSTELTTTDLTEVIQQTTGSSMTSSSSRGVGFYLQYAVIGVVGTAANGLVLYALIASGQHKKHVLIFNQNVLDFVSCVFLVATYSFRLCNVYLDGTLGYWLCVTLWGEGSSWGPYVGSLMNLAAVNIERYLKVVHPSFAKKQLRTWTTYSTVAFTWIAGISVVAGVTVSTSGVVNGVCYSYVFWRSQAARTAYGVWQFVSLYAIILLIFTFCYWRMLVVVRRQASVMAAHTGPGSTSAAQTQTDRMQASTIKTMMLVSVLFTVSWAPASVYSLMWYTHSIMKVTEAGLYTATFMGYLYICTNPFIYATKFDPVKDVLVRLVPCKKTSRPPESIETS